MVLFSKRLNICRFSPLRTAPRGSVEAEIAKMLIRVRANCSAYLEAYKLSMVVSDHSARILECINYHTY